MHIEQLRQDIIFKIRNKRLEFYDQWSIVFDQLVRTTQEHMAIIWQQNASGKRDDYETRCLLGQVMQIKKSQALNAKDLSKQQAYDDDSKAI